MPHSQVTNTLSVSFSPVCAVESEQSSTEAHDPTILSSVFSQEFVHDVRGVGAPEKGYAAADIAGIALHG